jgi:hypothetical protein
MDNTTSEIGPVPLKSGITTVSIEDESAATNTSISHRTSPLSLGEINAAYDTSNGDISSTNKQELNDLNATPSLAQVVSDPVTETTKMNVVEDVVSTNQSDLLPLVNQSSSKFLNQENKNEERSSSNKSNEEDERYETKF